MTATIHPFPRLKGDYEPSQTACSYLPSQAEILRQTHQHIAEAWRLRAESRRIQRDYEARQRKIEELMDGLGI